jgi:hypothetical protein
MRDFIKVPPMVTVSYCWLSPRMRSMLTARTFSKIGTRSVRRGRMELMVVRATRQVSAIISCEEPERNCES